MIELFGNTDVAKSIYNSFSPKERRENRLVSKSWNKQFNQDKTSSIIESTYRIVKDLWQGKFNELQLITSQICMHRPYEDNEGKISYIVKHIPSPSENQNVAVPFNGFDHLRKEDKASLTSKFFSLPIIEFKTWLAGKEQTREHYEEFEKLGYDTLDKNKLTTMNIKYETDSNNSICKIKEVSFEPIKEGGELHIDPDVIDEVEKFFKDRKINIPQTPEKSEHEKNFESTKDQLSSNLESAKGQINSFIKKHF